MANGNDTILTEAGTLSSEEQAAREAAGTSAAKVGLEELAGEYQADVEEQIYGDVGDMALTAIEGGARGLSFGLSDLAFGDAETATRQRVNRGTAIASELAGAVLPSLASGGAGAAGTIARLTPVGRLSALTARVAAGGGSTMARVGRGAVAGVIEGAAGGAGNYLSRQALDENAEFSAESLLASAGMGAVLGGAIGGGTVAAQSLGDVLATRMSDGPGIGRLLQDAPAPTRGASVKRLNYRQILGKPKAEKFADDLGVIAQRIEAGKAAAVSTELDTLLSTPAVVAQLGDGLPAMRGRISRLIEEQQQSAAMADDWARRYSEALGVQDLASARNADVTTVWAREIPDELDEIGPRWLAQLDEDTAKVAAIRDELQAMAGGQPTSLSPVAAQPGMLRRAADVGSTVAGGVELAQDAGIGGPSLRNIPVIGEALSAFVRLRAGAKALQGLGMLPATRVAQSAATVQTTRDRIAATIAGSMRRVARAGGVRQAAVITGKKAAAQIARLQQEQDIATASKATAEAERGDTGPAVAGAAASTAERARAYLLDQAPKNPYAGSAWGEKWAPTNQEARDWARRVSVVQDPVRAIKTIMDSPFNTLEAEALRQVYPAMWAEAREQVQADAERLIRSLSPAQAMAVGRAFEVPLHPLQLPGVLSIQPQVAPMAPLSPQFGQPSVANTSPLVTDTMTAREARMSAR